MTTTALPSVDLLADFLSAVDTGSDTNEALRNEASAMTWRLVTTRECPLLVELATAQADALLFKFELAVTGFNKVKLIHFFVSLLSDLIDNDDSVREPREDATRLRELLNKTL